MKKKLTYKRNSDVSESNVPGGILLILLSCKNLLVKKIESQ